MSFLHSLPLLACRVVSRAVLACVRPAAAGYFFYGYWFSHRRA